MKKAFAVILLIIGSMAACAAGGICCLCLFGFLLQAMVIPSLLLLSVHVTVAIFLHKKLRSIVWLRSIGFWLCTGLPGIIVGGAALIVTNMLDNAGYFTGFMAGLGEFLFSLSFFAYSAAYLAAAGAVLLIQNLISSRNNKEKP